MSDVAALTTEKNTLIAEMIELQAKFMVIEREKGVTNKEYYMSEEGLFKDYRNIYMEKAMRVVELSHKIVGSER